ncbi:hypothetical protein EV191_10570 [Tamaricihabitans halophyticus]|uniref:Uncharacterized protein n=1 Tax=Tamaricihabitans halophyticus TaxID=1262583 RepID=A0A4R2QVU5_9PSEU|nr:hypothetical protein EV191_10570 [Tamaricihabitans halophyticus]
MSVHAGSVGPVSERIQLSQALPGAYQDLLRLHTTVRRAAADAGLEQSLIELVKVRVSS